MLLTLFVEKQQFYAIILRTVHYEVIGIEKEDRIDFYAFNKGDMWYISFVIIIAAIFFIGWITRFCHNEIVSPTNPPSQKTAVIH